MSPVIADVGTVEIPVFAKITKLPAVPRTTRAGPLPATAPVVKLHANAPARALPCRSLIPAPSVAVSSALLTMIEATAAMISEATKKMAQKSITS